MRIRRALTPRAAARSITRERIRAVAAVAAI
jgi:hypothetical protein